MFNFRNVHKMLTDVVNSNDRTYATQKIRKNERLFMFKKEVDNNLQSINIFVNYYIKITASNRENVKNIVDKLFSRQCDADMDYDSVSITDMIFKKNGTMIKINGKSYFVSHENNELRLYHHRMYKFLTCVETKKIWNSYKSRKNKKITNIENITENICCNFNRDKENYDSIVKKIFG